MIIYSSTRGKHHNTSVIFDIIGNPENISLLRLRKQNNKDMIFRRILMHADMQSGYARYQGKIS